MAIKAGSTRAASGGANQPFQLRIDKKLYEKIKDAAASLKPPISVNLLVNQLLYREFGDNKSRW